MVGSAALTLLTVSPSHAQLSACGDIHVEAEAECSLETSGGCTVNCTPLNFELACEAEVRAACDLSRCNANVEASCTAACEAECEAECAVDPGAFDCQGECRGSCSADCQFGCDARAEAACEAESDEGRAQCEASARASCEASCDATCEGECSASCEGTPPSAECSGKCEASCQGQCKVEVNAECRIECRSENKAACTARMEGDCRADCTTPEGALFCDGQYVDHGDNLQNCINALNAVLVANVDVSASGDAEAECRGNRCDAEAEGKASVSCASVGGHRSGSAPTEGALVLLGLMLAGGRRAGKRRA